MMRFEREWKRNVERIEREAQRVLLEDASGLLSSESSVSLR